MKRHLLISDFALVKWAGFPLTGGEGSDFSDSRGTGISLPMLPALQEFPAAPLTHKPGSAPSLRHGTSWALWMPALQLQGQGHSLSALKSKCALQGELSSRRKRQKLEELWQEGTRSGMTGTGAQW